MTGNATCFAHTAASQSPPLIRDGNLVFQAHHVGWLITAIFAMIACVASGWLINKHLQWYTNKKEQRYIVRILFLVPIYALVSFAAYLFWDHSTALIIIRDCYESTVLTAFFYLLLLYISPSPDEQRLVFLKKGLSQENDRITLQAGLPLRKWMFPLGFVNSKPRDGAYFLQIMKWGVLQYCVIRPLTTLVSVVLNYIGLYCEASWSPAWGHIYITLIVSISVSIAMYCLIQLYVVVSDDLAPHRPLLKLFAVKAVVFLTFWQATLLGVLAAFKVVKDTEYMTAEQINIGFGAILECLEMSAFAFLHIRAFTYKSYRNATSEDADNAVVRISRLKALIHAFNFSETYRELVHGVYYMSDHIRGKEPRPDHGLRRLTALEDVFPNKRRVHSVNQTYSSGLAGLNREKIEDGWEHDVLDQMPTFPYVGKFGYRSLPVSHQCIDTKNTSAEYVPVLDPLGPVATSSPSRDVASSRRSEIPTETKRQPKYRRDPYTIEGPMHYEDVPPASALHAYRLAHNICEPSLSLPVPPVIHLQEPTESVSPSLFRQPKYEALTRNDSMLRRIFAYSTPSSSATGLSGSTPSNQAWVEEKVLPALPSPVSDPDMIGHPAERLEPIPARKTWNDQARPWANRSFLTQPPPHANHVGDDQAPILSSRFVLDAMSRPRSFSQSVWENQNLAQSFPPTRQIRAPLSFIIHDSSPYSDYSLTTSRPHADLN